jgi:predicted transcriptional regulator
MRFTKITIIQTRISEHHNINEELQWLGGSLGLFNPRDKDKSCFRIFIALVQALKSGRGYSSDELASKLSLSRGTVVFHLNKLMQSGIVTSERNKYFLAVDNLEQLVDLVKENLSKTCDKIKEVAQDIDKKLEL